MERFGLYVILTDPVAGYEACAQAAVAEEIRYLQLRMKNTPRDRVLAMAEKLRNITRGTRTLFIVNDDVEIAAAVDADGVHLGQGDLALPEARARWPNEGKRFGLSTHSLEQARAAWNLAPDYIGVGPVFATPTKAVPDPVLGLEAMGSIVRQSPLTTVAIGGLQESNLREVLEHGAINFCAVRPIMQAMDPRGMIRRLMQLWREQASMRS